MQRIRVMLRDKSNLWCSMVAGQLGDVELVEAGHDLTLAEALASAEIDVLLMRADRFSEVEALFGDLARAAPIGFVAIDSDGRSGTAYRFESRPVAAAADGRLDLAGAIALAAGKVPRALH